MSATRGIDISTSGAIDVCKVYKWTGVPEAAWPNFIRNMIISGTPIESNQSYIDDYGWGASEDRIAVRYICQFIPLITGLWQWGFYQEDDKVRMLIKESDMYGKTVYDVQDYAGNYTNLWMIAGRTYYLDIRWYELIGPGYVRPRFMIPGDSTLRVIQTTADICQIRIDNGFLDNTPLLSVVL